MAEKFDIVIVGGGMVGSVLAHALVLEGWQVAIVEATPPAENPSFDERVTALSEGSWRYLDGLGLVTAALKGRAQPIREVRVSQRGHLGLTRIEADEMGVAALGRVVCNQSLRLALEAAPSCQAVRRIEPARFVSLVQTDEQVTATISTETGTRSLEARLLVAADGVRSSVREAAGIAVRSRDYGQDALIVRLRPERSHRGIAFEHFTDSGPLAVLPMVDGLCSGVVTLWREDSEDWCALDDEAFAERLNRRFGQRLGRLRALPGRAVYPLVLSQAESLVSGRVTVLGNAAHGLHPVAGQGFNLCLRDVRHLVDALRPARDAVDPARRHGDPGAPEPLARWAADRLRDHRRTVGLTDGLVGGFSNRSALVDRLAGPLRGAGLTFLDKCPPLKRTLARLTMGV
ncbi:MAG: FAD-dependent oxidoreductase [Halothiobacillaceae bacterium]